jgi:hypothetical protein
VVDKGNAGFEDGFGGFGEPLTEEIIQGQIASKLRRLASLELALARRDALLRKWLEWHEHPTGLVEETKAELGDSHE